MLSVILPTYERSDAVLCCLAALDAQQYKEYELILVDDSDSDNVQTAVAGFLDRHIPLAGRTRYMRSTPPRVGSFTAGRARNIGVANARFSLCVFVDQDVMLAPDALAHYAQAHERHGDNTIIVGLYHWLHRLDFTPADVGPRFSEIVASGLKASTAFKALSMREPGLLGPDMREAQFSDDIEAVVPDAALGAWSGNIGYPRDLFIKVGGFDETITGHGGEDADLGLTCKAAGAQYLLYRPIWGAHIWHDRDQKKNEKEVQINIEYIDRKHGVGQYAEAQRFGIDAQDWTETRHYQKAVGGVLMQEAGDPTIWVCKNKHRLGLPTPEWIKKLGFKTGDILQVPAGALRTYEAEGICI